jgi:VCBS repeat-containing protein
VKQLTQAGPGFLRQIAIRPEQRVLGEAQLTSHFNGGRSKHKREPTRSPDKPRRRRALGIMALEPRVMYDAAAPAAAAAAAAPDVHAATDATHVAPPAPPPDWHVAPPAPAAQPAPPPYNPALAPTGSATEGPASTSGAADASAAPSSPAESSSSVHEVVFIDSRVPDLQDLINGVKPGTSVFVLDPDRDGVQQIADILAANQFHDLDAIQIVSHGSEGEVHLGSTFVDDASLAAHAGALADIGATLRQGGDILLYGCDVADGAAGQKFLADLSRYAAGADIAASTDLTGSAALGGDWTLEATTGAIEATTPFTDAALTSYTYVLAPPVINNLGTDTASFTEDSGPVLLDQGTPATVTDPDAPAHFNGGNLTVSISAGGTTSEDALSIVDGSGISVSGNNVLFGLNTIGTVSGGTGGNALVITFTTTDASPTAVSALVGRIAYQNTNTFDPSTSARTARFVFNDGTELSAAADVTVNVSALNDAPTAVGFANTTTSIAENTSTATPTKVADITVTDDALGTNTLTLSGADAASFEIVGTELFLKAGVTLDFETKSSYAVTVNVDDAGVGVSPDAFAAFTLTVTDVNEAPTVGLANTTTSIAENTSTATPTKVADITVTDDALGTNTLTLSGADAASFEIVGTELFLKAGVTLDFETKSSYAVTVNVDDAGVGVSPDAFAAFTLTVTDVNEAPTAVGFANTTTSIAENTSTATPTKVADITVTDDALGTNTLTLSGADAASFEIVGTELFLKAGVTLDFEAKSSYAVTVNVDDAGVGLSPDAFAAFTLTATDVNEAPTAVGFANTTTSIAENTSTATPIKVADITVTDDALGTNTLTLSGADAASFEIVGAELFLKAGVTLNFEVKSSYSVTVNVNDAAVGGTPDAFAVFTLNVSNVNEAPVNTVPAGPIAALEDSVTTISGLSISDVDAGSGNVSVTLSVLHGIIDVRTNVVGGVTASNVSGDTTGSVTLTGTLTQVNATLAASAGVTYRPNLNYTGADTLTMTSNDLGHSGSGGALSGAAQMVAINVTAVTAQTLSAFQSYTLTNDVDGDNVVDPNDTVTVTVNIANNSSTVDVTGLTFLEVLNGLTIVPGTFNISPLAFDDAYSAVGNTELIVGGTASGSPAVVVAGGLFANDVEFANDLGAMDTFTIKEVNGAAFTGMALATANGTVTVNIDGTFTYTPNAGFSGTDTFTYTITDNGMDNVAGNADDLTGSATVTITVGSTVWYVDTTAASNGTGTSTNPFNTITGTNLNGAGGIGDVDDTGDYIYLEGSATAAFALEDGQHLIGTGSALVVDSIQLATAGTRSTLTNASGTTLTLASGNDVQGLNVTNTGGSGISGSGFGTLTVHNVAVNASGQALGLSAGSFAATSDFASIDSTGGTNNISLSGVTGSVNLGSGTLSGATGVAFNVSGGSVSTTYSGNITESANAALLSVTGGHTGTLTFQTGTLSATTGTGLQFDNADGTYNFNGTTTLNGGDAGIDILGGSSGTFTFASGTTITNPSGTAFNLASSNATVTYSGSISDNTGFAVDIDNHDSGTITFQTGTMASTGSGVRVANSNGGTINFNSASMTLNTGANKAVTLDTSNAGGTINFGGGNLDIDTTTGTGFSALSGGTLSVTGANNSINATSGAALDVETTTIGASGLNFNSVTSANSGTFGVKLASVTGGAIVLGSGSISNATGAAFLVGDGAGTANTGGTSAISYTGSITSGTGRAVDIQDRASGAGNITLSGNITHVGTTATGIFLDTNAAGVIAFTGASKAITTTSANAVSLTSNTGATINFTNGGLVINATSGTGFNATSGGTVTVQGSANTITTTTGTALNVANTTIGASGLTFRSITAGTSSDSAGVGISLDTTGSSGGLTVTGTGSGFSGGAIQHKTGADGSATGGIGIYLRNTSNVSLSNMHLNDFQNFGIRGIGVNNFTLANSTIDSTASATSKIGNSDAANEAAIAFGTDDLATNGLTGTASITNSTIADGFENVFQIYNHTGSLNLTVSGSSFSDTSTASPGNIGMALKTDGSASLTANISTTNFLNNRGRGIFAINQGTGALAVNIGTNGVAGSGGTFTDNFIAVDIAGNSAGTVSFNVLNTTITTAGYASKFGAGTAGSAINIFMGADVVPVERGAISGNIIGNNINNSNSGTGPGININATGTDNTGGNTVTVKIDSNIVAGVAANGILVASGDGNPTINATITNNTVTTTTIAALEAIRVNAGKTSSQAGSPGTADNGTINLDVRGNTLTVDPAAGVSDIRVRQRFNTTFRIEDYAGGATDTTAVATYLSGLNNGNPVSADFNNSGFQNINDVPEPPAPLMAMPGDPPPSGPAAGSDGETPAGEQTATPGDSETPVTSVTAPAETPPTDSPAAGDQSADGSDTSPIVDDGVLSQAELDFMVAAAIERWEASGLSAAQLDALHATHFTVADMSGWMLGAYAPGEIRLDINAAGYGWFIDATPGNDAEFAQADGTHLTASPGQAPAGHFDLLTTVMHEMGHVLGLTDSYVLSDRTSLMYGYLVAGERRLPGAGQANGAVVGSLTEEEFLGAPVTIGTLPAGRTITIQWQATVDNTQSNAIIVNPMNQGTVSASNAVGFPDVTTNESVITLDSLALGNRVFKDAPATFNGQYDAGEGVDGVALTLFADTNNNGALDGGDTQIATTVTSDGGLYSFTGLARGDYIVRVDQSNFDTGGVLTESGSPLTSVPGNPDPDNNVDNDDNGGAIAGNGVASQAITLGYNNEPTAGNGNDTNDSLDFGFQGVPPNNPPVVTVTVNDTVTFTEGGPAVSLITAPTTLTITDSDDANLESALVRITPATFLAGDQLQFTAQGGIVGGYDAATGVLTLTGSASVADYQAVLNSITFLSTSDNPTAAGTQLTRTVEWITNDGTINSNTASRTISVAGQNDAPSVTSATLASVAEDTTSPAGQTVATLFTGHFNDPDNPTATISGIAVIGNTATIEGTWAYSTNSGADWFAIGTVGNTGNALALSASTLIRFVPAADFNGSPPSLTVHGLDDTYSGFTSGASRVEIAVASSGGTSAISATATTIGTSVTPVNDAPLLDNGASPVLAGVGEDAGAPVNGTAAGTLVSSLVDLPGSGGLDNVDDVDSGAVAGIAVTGVSASGTLYYSIDDGATWTAAGAVSDGSALVLAADGSTRLYFQPNANFNGTIADAITFRAWDRTDGSVNGATGVNTLPAGGISAFSTATDTAAITVTAANDAPDLTPNAPGAVSYTENAASPTALLATGAVSDIDAPTNFTGGSLTVAINTGTVAGDQIVLLTTSPFHISGSSLLDASDNIIGTIAGEGTTSVSVTGLTSFATPAVVNQLLASFGFQSTSEDPGAGDRTVRFTFDDGGNTGSGSAFSDFVDQTVQVVPQNDAPVIANVTANAFYPTGAPPVTLSGGTTLSDVDSTTLASAQVTISDGIAGDQLSVSGAMSGSSGGISWNFAGNVLSFTGVASVASYQALLDQVQYGSTSADPGSGGTDLTRTITWQVNDGGSGGASNVPTTTVTLNAPPVLAGDNVIEVQEGGTVTVTTADLTATDTDTLDPSLVYSVTASAHGTVLVGGSALGTFTQADLAAGLVSFAHDGGELDGSFSVSVSDGISPAVTATVTATVNPHVNDAPVLDDLAANTAYTENGPPKRLALDADVSDADSPSLDSVTVRIASGMVAGDTLAADTTGTSITASYDAVTGTLLLSGTDGVGNYQQVLRTVTYVSSSDNPTDFGASLTRTVEWQLDDGSGGPNNLSLLHTTTITISAVNDAPVAADDGGTAVEASGVANATAGANATGNVITDSPGTDTDVDNFQNTLVVSGVTGGTVGVALTGSHGTLTLNADGSYTYVVDDNDPQVEALRISGQTLTDNFSYTISDPDGLTSTANLVITIDGRNDAPVTQGDTASATEAGGLGNATAGVDPTGNVLTNDSDVDSVANGETETVTTTGIFVGAHGTLTLNGDGSYTYVVNNNDAAVEALRTAADTLTDSFSYTMTDTAGLTASANLIITIHGQNDTPVANVDTASATEAGGIANSTAGVDPSGNVLTNDTDADSAANGETRTVTTTGTFVGTYGTLTLGADGSYHYAVNNNDPAVQALRTSGQTLSESFNYTMTDTAGTTSSSLLTVTIQGVNDTPVANADTAVAVEAGGLLNGTAGTDPAGNVLTNDTDVDSVANGETRAVATTGSFVGAHGTLTLAADGSFHYVVDNADLAVQALRTSAETLTDTFAYTVVDAAGATSIATVTIAIHGVNDAPVAQVDTPVATAAGGVDNQTPGVDPTGNVLTNDIEVDGGDTQTVIDVNGSAANVGQALAGAFGTLTLAADGTYTYVVDNNNPSVLALDIGKSLTETFTYTMRDTAGAVSTTTLTITIDGQGRIVPPPHVDSGGRAAPDIRGADSAGGPGQFGMVTSVNGGDRGFFRDPTVGTGGSIHVVTADITPSFTPDGRVSFEIPLLALRAELGGDIVSITATLIDGSPLPTWLAFNGATGQFAGLLPDIATGSLPPDGGVSPNGDGEPPRKLTIRVMAIDTQGNIALITFTIDLSPGLTGTLNGKSGHLLPFGPAHWLPGLDLTDRDAGVAPMDAGHFNMGLLPGWPPGDAAAAAPAGRAGLSEQLNAIGWRGMNAERMALIQSLRQSVPSGH